MTLDRVALLSIHSSPLARIGSGYAGGMNVYVRRLADGLASRGVAVDMFTRRASRDDPEIVETDSGARLIYLDMGPARSLPRTVLPLHVPAAVHSMRNFMAREDIRYDVLHSHYWLSGLVATRVRDDERIPVVQMFHTLSKVKELYSHGADPADTALRPDGERCVINHANAIVGATQEERALLERLYGRSPRDFAVIPPGVDLDFFQPLNSMASRARLGIDGGPVVLFVGRLDPLKGLDVLLQAGAAARAAFGPGLRLVILGHDPIAERLQLGRYTRLASRLGIAENVLFAGVAPPEDLPAYYSAADVLAVPSAYESFGMAAIESMACGTPVVGFRNGGIATTVRDGQTGFLAEPGDREDFARVLIHALRSDSLQHMGRQAHLAAQRFRWDTVTERSLALYGRLLHASYLTSRPAAGAQ